MTQFIGANYKSQVDDILDHINRKSRITQCIQCYNEEAFIGYTLQSIYNEVDRILVVEGAVANRMKGESPRSIDGTIDIIKDFKKNQDKDGKLTLIQMPQAFESLEAMKQVFLNASVENDYLLINDADEFYRPEDIRRLRITIDRYPLTREIVPLFLHFWRDFSHIKIPAPEWQPQHQRFFKYRRGMKYNNHPIVTDPEGHCTYFSPHYQPRRLLLNQFYVWHYGYARPNLDELMREKQSYYKNELDKFGATQEFDEKVVEFLERTESIESVATYSGNHPAVMRTHPLMEHQDSFLLNKQFQDWKLVSPYKEDLANEPYGNIWLWMQGLNPRMEFYHNGVIIDD